MMALGRHRKPAIVPWGFLAALLLIALIERGMLHNNPSYLSMHAANWQFADKQIEKSSRGYDLLCFGDSQVKFGVLPKVVKAQSGITAYNFAVTLGPAPASYFLLRRALEKGVRPRAILVDFYAGIQKEGPGSGRLPYPWSDLLHFRDALDLAWASRQADLLTQTMLGRVFHGLKDRAEIRACIMAAFRGQPNHRAAEIAISRRNWNRNLGGQANFKTTFPELAPPTGTARSEWACDPINEVYIQRFMTLAQKHGLPVYWVIPPVSPMAQRHNTARGEDEPFDLLVKRTQANYPKLIVLDGRNSELDQSYFVDDRHLDRDGAIALSAAVGDLLSRGLPNGSRWIDLSLVAKHDLAIAVEDSEESLRAFRGGGRGGRR